MDAGTSVTPADFVVILITAKDFMAAKPTGARQPMDSQNRMANLASIPARLAGSTMEAPRGDFPPADNRASGAEGSTEVEDFTEAGVTGK
jgi:hypothetical protein